MIFEILHFLFCAYHAARIVEARCSWDWIPIWTDLDEEIDQMDLPIMVVFFMNLDMDSNFEILVRYFQKEIVEKKSLNYITFFQSESANF